MNCACGDLGPTWAGMRGAAAADAVVDCIGDAGDERFTLKDLATDAWSFSTVSARA